MKKIIKQTISITLSVVGITLFSIISVICILAIAGGDGNLGLREVLGIG